MKYDLARRFPTDRNAYTEGKDEIVAQILGRTLNPPEHHRDRQGGTPVAAKSIGRTAPE